MNETKVKPYIARIKQWKVRAMVASYLSAGQEFKQLTRTIKKKSVKSLETLRQISDVLYEVKEDHHLVFERLLEPEKHKFEKTGKFFPNKIELDFMNNVGLLFHKILVARELKYLTEHYADNAATFQEIDSNFKGQLTVIERLFDAGLKIIKDMICQNKENVLLLTLLIENSSLTRSSFGFAADKALERFAGNEGLDNLYYRLGKYYSDCGRPVEARTMLKRAVRENKTHRRASQLLLEIVQK